MRNLPGANKSDWGDEIDSLKVGPTATVTVWEDENFGDNSQNVWARNGKDQPARRSGYGRYDRLNGNQV